MEKGALNTAQKLLVIGGSAGSLEVVLGLLPELEASLPLAVLVVLHRKSSGDASLENLFRYKTRLPVREVEDKDPIRPGTIYIAPVDFHLLIEKGHTFALDFSEKIHFSRPSIDVTFESASDVYGENLACLLLSGANADGAAGIAVARGNGGQVVVQDPETAAVALMPESGLAALGGLGRTIRPEELPDFVRELYGK